jgi:hypothetical protein
MQIDCSSMYPVVCIPIHALKAAPYMHNRHEYDATGAQTRGSCLFLRRLAVKGSDGHPCLLYIQLVRPCMPHNEDAFDLQ